VSEPNPEIPLAFTRQEWNVLLTGLYELPMRLAAQVANKLQTQLAEIERPKALKPTKEAAS
jgi:hypothetical protein